MFRFKSSSTVLFGLIVVLPHFDQAQTPSADFRADRIRTAFLRALSAPDGPLSQVWGRGPELPRVFFPERLPAFFSKTIAFESDFPRQGRLSWIFTGREGGFTIDISHTTVRVYQRYNDSYGLLDSHTSNPERIVQESFVPISGELHSVSVTLDAHLSLIVGVNGTSVVQQNCSYA